MNPRPANRVGRSMALFLGVSSVGCASGTVLDKEPQDCSEMGRLEYVEERMLDEYLWADQVEPVDLSSYSDPTELMADLRYADVDRWSYVLDLEEAESWFESGVYVGGGYTLRADEAGEVRFALVYPDNPAAAAGIRRGDRLDAVNGVSVADLVSEADWVAAFGPAEAGAEVVLLVASPGEAERETTMVLGEVVVPPVMAQRTVVVGDRTVLYFMLTTFVEPSHAALDALFQSVTSEGVDTVVVDLRYNGGGLISVARHLASLVATAHAGEVFTTYAYNADHVDQNTETYLDAYDHGITARDVVFLTSGSTGSASEMLMFALEPYLPVTRVGAVTAGKPVGMNFYEACDLFVAPITFQTGNRDTLGTYFDGLAPDCDAQDELLSATGGDDDPMWQAALEMVAGSDCPTAARRVSVEPRRTGPLPGGTEPWLSLRAGGSR